MRRCLHSLQSTELLYLVQDRWCRFPGVSRFHLGSIRPLWFGRQRPAPVVRRTRLLSVASCRSCPEERKEKPPVSSQALIQSRRIEGDEVERIIDGLSVSA